MATSTERPAPPTRRSAGPASITVTAVVACLLASLGLAAIAYAIGTSLSSTYQSFGLIRVAVPSQQGAIDPVVTAANDTASQYAQLVSSQPVATLTAARLGVSPATLRGKISGSTTGAQNLVQVAVTGDSAAAATRRAAAATISVQHYISALNASASSQYLAEVQRGLAPVDRQITRALVRIARTRPSGRSANTVVLQALNTQRAQLLGEVARDAASNRPTLQLVESSSPATVVSPKPKLYALVALVVGLIVFGRLAFVLVRRQIA